MNKMTDSSSQLTLENSKTRKKFLKLVLEHCRSSRSTYEWRTRKWIQNKIRDMEAMKTSYHRMYQVEEICGVKVLKIASSGRGNNMQIVPVEDYFDVIYAAHISTGHGARSVIKSYFENRNLFVPGKAVIYYLKLCKACIARKDQNQLRSFRIYHGYLELIDMSDTPDGKYKLVMHYRALKLRRVFLRPLCSSNAVEVAEHLAELFCQVGPPRVLHSPNKLFTKALILRLAIDYPDCKIIPGKVMELEERTKDIKANIKNWMSLNECREWSKGVYELTGFEYKGRKLEKLEQHQQQVEQVSDSKNLPGPSSVRQECQDRTLKKEAHELYLQENISTDEVIQLLKPTKTYTKITPETVPLKSQSETKVKTYTRNKKDNSQKIIPVISNKEEPPGNKALCVDTNLREVAWKPSKIMKKRHAVWNSTLDLPDQTASNVKHVIGMNSISNEADFGLLPNDLLDDVIYDQDAQLNLLNKSSSDALESNNIKEEEPCFKTTIDYSALDSTERKDEKPPFVTADDFHEEKPRLEGLLNSSSSESKYIQKELFAFEIPINSNPLINSIKVEEETPFGKIVKVESMIE